MVSKLKNALLKNIRNVTKHVLPLNPSYIIVKLREEITWKTKEQMEGRYENETEKNRVAFAI
jgi:hypothetical protein